MSNYSLEIPFLGNLIMYFQVLAYHTKMLSRLEWQLMAGLLAMLIY
jgi:hypothetical protein